MTSDERFAKTHLPFHLWEDNIKKHPEVKIIQTLRNPKDTLVSYYHHSQSDLLQGYFNGSWDDYFSLIEKKQLAWGDYFDHIVPWYQFNKNRENSLIIKYEDMKKDHKGHVIKIADFLGHNITEYILSVIVHETSFNEMFLKYKACPLPGWHPERDPFVRKGQVGGWVNYFTAEQGNFIDEKCKEYLEPIGISFSTNT